MKVARRVFAHKLAAAIRGRRRIPAQRVELVIAHDAERLTGVHHAMYQMQRLANAWPAINDVAEEQRHAPRMPPDASLHAVTEGVEQAFKGVRTTVHITNQVIATSRIKLHSAFPHCNHREGEPQTALQQRKVTPTKHFSIWALESLPSAQPAPPTQLGPANLVIVVAQRMDQLQLVRFLGDHDVVAG